jgi:hypothetical protein
MAQATTLLAFAEPLVAVDRLYIIRLLSKVYSDYNLDRTAHFRDNCYLVDRRWSATW